MAADPRSMESQVSNQEIAMTMPCGLHAKFEHLIVAIDAVVDDGTLTTDFVENRLLQEEQRMAERGSGATSNDSALVINTVSNRNNRQVSVCFYCHKRGHSEPRYWTKYRHEKPGNKGIVADSFNEVDASDNDSYV